MERCGLHDSIAVLESEVKKSGFKELYFKTMLNAESKSVSSQHKKPYQVKSTTSQTDQIFSYSTK